MKNLEEEIEKDRKRIVSLCKDQIRRNKYYAEQCKQTTQHITILDIENIVRDSCAHSCDPCQPDANCFHCGKSLVNQTCWYEEDDNKESDE